MNSLLIVLLVLIALALIGVIVGIVLMIKWIIAYKKDKREQLEERIAGHLFEREE